MHTHTIEGRALAIVAGGICALATVGIVLEDVILHNAELTLKHALTVVVIGVTIAMGHLASKAWSAKQIGSWFCFSVLFLAGTLLTVHASVGRQAGGVMVTTATIEEAASERVRIKPLLEQAEAMKLNTAKKLEKDCVNGTKGKTHCDGLRTSLAVYESSVKGHKSDLERLGPQKIAAPEAKHAGQIASVFGFDASKVEAGAILLVPFLTTVFLELGSIFCIGYGFRPVRRVSANDNAQTSFPVLEPLPPARMIEPDRKGSNIVDWSRSFERVHGRKPRLDEAQAAFPNVSRSTTYRRLKAA